MSLVTTNAAARTAAHDLAKSAFARWLAELAASWSARRECRQTMRELSALDDRELHDIGLTRGDIPFVARNCR